MFKRSSLLRLSVLALFSAFLVLLCACTVPANAQPFVDVLTPFLPGLKQLAAAIVIGILGAAYTLADKNPRLHAIFSLLSSIGFDVPKFLVALQQLWTGKFAGTSGGGSMGGGGGGSGGSPMAKMAEVQIPPVPERPKFEMRALHPSFFVAPAAIMALATGTLVTQSACTKAQEQQAVSTIESGATEIATYANTFLSFAQAVWASIAPFVTPAINAEYNTIVATVAAASTAVQDLGHATSAVFADGGTDLPTAEANLKGAVSALYSFIALYSYSGTTADGGVVLADRLARVDITTLASLRHSAEAIRDWK